MAFEMFHPHECLAAALVWTGPLALPGVFVEVAPQLAGGGESPGAALRRTRVRPLAGVGACVLLQTTHLVELTVTTLKGTHQVCVTLVDPHVRPHTILRVKFTITTSMRTSAKNRILL